MQATAEEWNIQYVPETYKILKEMATANNYKVYQIHGHEEYNIVPRAFIESMINSKRNLNELIDDLAKIHEDAAFYEKLNPETKEKIKKETEIQKSKAREAVKNNEMKYLRSLLFNIPSNLYPVNRSIKTKIPGKFDPPRKGMKTRDGNVERLPEASKIAKYLYNKYKALGLEIAADDLGRAQTSDVPPKDVYITIT